MINASLFYTVFLGGNVPITEMYAWRKWFQIQNHLGATSNLKSPATPFFHTIVGTVSRSFHARVPRSASRFLT